MPSSARDPLAATARWTAAARALEHERADRLFADPWAAVLAGPEGRQWMESRSADSALPIILRTRYFDDWLSSIVASHGLDQVVILAAGLDTRAYRLGWPSGVVVFEVDRPEVLDAKATLLTEAGAHPGCDRRPVAADIGSVTWSATLAGAGFAADRPTAWLIEGLLFYLGPATIGRVLDGLTDMSAAESHLGFDIVNAATLTSEWTRPWVEMQAAAGAPWLGTMEDPVAALADRGWAAGLTQAGQPDAHYGRWTLPVLPTTMSGVPHHWLVTAARH